MVRFMVDKLWIRAVPNVDSRYFARYFSLDDFEVVEIDLIRNRLKNSFEIVGFLWFFSRYFFEEP